MLPEAPCLSYVFTYSLKILQNHVDFPFWVRSAAGTGQPKPEDPSLLAQAARMAGQEVAGRMAQLDSPSPKAQHLQDRHPRCSATQAGCPAQDITGLQRRHVTMCDNICSFWLYAPLDSARSRSSQQLPHLGGDSATRLPKNFFQCPAGFGSLFLAWRD